MLDTTDCYLKPRSITPRLSVLVGLLTRYAAIAFVCGVGLSGPGNAATFGRATLQVKPTLSLEDIRKRYKTKIVHGSEHVVIDDMLFPITQFSIRAGLTGEPWPNGNFIIAFAPNVNRQNRDAFKNACAKWSVGAHVACNERTPAEVDR